MKAADAIGLLRERQPDLNAAGVAHLSIFGSIARDDLPALRASCAAALES